MYDIESSGVFVLTKTPRFTVQYISRSLPSGGLPYILAMALHFEECVYVIQASRPAVQGLKCEHSRIRVTHIPKESKMVFDLPEGSQVVAFDRGKYLDVYVYAARYALEKTSGICGPFTDGPNTKVTTLVKGVKVNSKPSELIEASRVQEADNLFTCMEAKNCKSQGTTMKAVKTCIVQEIQGCKFQGNATEKYVLPKGAVVPPIREPKPLELPPSSGSTPTVYELTPKFKKLATEACNKAIPNPDATQICDPTFFVESCIKDVIVNGNPSVVDVYKQAYMNQVDKLVSTELKDPIVQANFERRDALEKIKQSLGFAGMCPDNCSGHGECSEGIGCVCDPDTTGFKCEVYVKDFQLKGPKQSQTPYSVDDAFKDITEDKIQEIVAAHSKQYLEKLESDPGKMALVREAIKRAEESSETEMPDLKDGTIPKTGGGTKGGPIVLNTTKGIMDTTNNE